MKRIALYYRVSTDDQTTDAQRCELLDYCARRGWTDVREYADIISGAKFSRSGLNRLMGDVRAHHVDTIVCVKMDRLGRSLPHLAQLIAELDCHDVALICTSQGIDTSNDNPAGRLQMNILACVADFERSLIRERTKAGLAAARSRGVRLGRPRFNVDSVAQHHIEAYREGTFVGGITKLAQLIGCSTGKAHALVKSSDGITPGVDWAACPR
jgi:DNA invertase Pin-like site-specific DNA recombinase